MSSIKRKQYKPRKLFNNQRKIATEMQPLDLSKKPSEIIMFEEAELLDLSKKRNDFQRSDEQNFTENYDNNTRNSMDKPLDLRIINKKSEHISFNDFKNIKSSVTKLVRGQDEWMNNSRNNFISQILKCLVCSKSFEKLNDLSVHMLESKHFSRLPSTAASFIFENHRNISKNANTLFRKAFKTSKTSHVVDHSCQSVLLCLICKKTFPNGSNLVEHLQNSHTINQICTTCGAYFETSSAYNQHLIDEDYHHHNHHRSKHLLINQSTKLKSLKRELDVENEKTVIKKVFKINRVDKKLEDDGVKKKVNENSSVFKNPLSALELFVSNNEINCVNLNEKIKCDSNNKSKIVENPLNLLQKMHSNFNNYVF